VTTEYDLESIVEIATKHLDAFIPKNAPSELVNAFCGSLGNIIERSFVSHLSKHSVHSSNNEKTGRSKFASNDISSFGIPEDH
jgi:hypothetical protein